MHLIVFAYIGSSVSKLPYVGNANLEGGVDPVVVAGRPVLHVVEAFLLLLCGSLPRRLPLGVGSFTSITADGGLGCERWDGYVSRIGVA